MTPQPGEFEQPVTAVEGAPRPGVELVAGEMLNQILSFGFGTCVTPSKNRCRRRADIRPVSPRHHPPDAHEAVHHGGDTDAPDDVALAVSQMK